MILIVEDNRDLNAALCRLLQHEGYGIQMAADVDNALEHIAQRRPDLAIIDLHLPGQDGLTFITQLRTHFGDALPIVVLSADGELHTLRELAAAGVTTYFHKPVTAPVLTACLSSLLKSSRS